MDDPQGILEEFVAHEWTRRPEFVGLHITHLSRGAPVEKLPRIPCPLCGRIPAHHARFGCAPIRPIEQATLVTWRAQWRT